MKRLRLLLGPGAPASCDITGRVTVGRGVECTLVIPDARISRQHCVVEDREGGITLQDTSSNGTRLNGRLVREAGLNPGDRIVLAAGVELGIEEAPVTGASSPFETWPLGAAFPRLHVGVEDLAKGMEDLTTYLQALQLSRVGPDVVKAAASYLEGRVAHDRLALVLDPGGTRALHKDYGALARKWTSLPLSFTLVREAMAAGRAVLARSSGELTDSHSADVSRISSALAVAVPDAQGSCLAALYLDRLGESASLGEADLQEAARAALALGPALEAALLREKLASEHGSGDFTGSSAAAQALRETLAKVAVVDSPVVIEGSPGSGRRFVARLIHERSARWRAPLVGIDIASLSPELAASELFGHVKGAFTGAVSDREGLLARSRGGSVVLEHLDEAPAEIQALLLRVLDEGVVRPVGSTESKPVDFRVLATVSRPLQEVAREGRFRKDLLHRLEVFAVRVPPLSERPEDIEGLAGVFLDKIARRLGRPLPALTPELVSSWVSRPWPGGARELHNHLEKLLVLSGGATLQPETGGQGGEEPQALSLEAAVQAHIRRVLALAGGNKSRAAELLGIDRSTLYAKLKEM